MELLNTKVAVPPVRAEVVQRSRLESRLQEGAERKLTLVSARAGSGKTTLLSNWIAKRRQSRCAWFSLDAEDSEPLRFLCYLVSALQRLRQDFGKDILASISAPSPPATNGLVTSLLNEVGELEEDVVVVLDDFHLISGTAVPEALSFILDRMPPQMHLVVAGRVDPAMPLSRLRAQYELVEIRDAQLRFTPDETEEYFKAVQGLRLSAEQIGALERRTEGWVAGLQMAAISLQDADDVTDLVGGFTGEDRFVMDYLMEEVLARQPVRVREFLRKTSFLDRLRGPLCDAVTGLGRGQEMLEELERSNLFVVQLDHQRRWYRYHHLFADLLRHHSPPAAEEAADLRLRASSWYEAEGDAEGAIRHAIAGELWQRAASLLRKHALSLIMRTYDLHALQRWLDALPEVERLASPGLAFYHAWCLIQTGQLDRFEAPLERAEELWRSADKTSKLGLVMTARSVVELRTGQAARAVDLAQAAAATLSKGLAAKLSRENWTFRMIANLQLGFASLALGKPIDAKRPLEEVRAVALARGLTVMAAVATTLVQRAHAMLGQLAKSKQLGERFLRKIAGEGVQTEFGPRFRIGVIHYERNQLDEAVDCFEAAVEGARRLGRELQISMVHRALAEARWAQGRREEAWEALAHGRGLAERLGSEIELRNVEVTGARFHLALGRSAEVADWMARAHTAPDESTVYAREPECLVLARVLTQKRRFPEAVSLLSELQLHAEKNQRRSSVIAIAAHQALLRRAQGKRTEALAALESALDLAAGEAYVRTFVDLGPPLAALVREAHEKSIHSDYTGKLLDSFGAVEPPMDPQVPELLEPLSHRELEVAQLLLAGLSNPEIAERLYISLNTVKTHLKKIYGKLAVTSRAQAMARLRELRIS